MPREPESSDSRWNSAFAAALEGAPAACDGLLLFFEDREDLTVEVRSGQAPSSRRSRSRGLSCRAPWPRERLEFLSEPDWDDAVRLVDGALERRSPRKFAVVPPPIAEYDAVDRLSASSAAEMLQSVLSTLESLHPNVVGHATSVAFEQRVCIGRSGHPILSDRRSASRVRLVAHLERGGRRATGVGDAVLDARGQPRGSSFRELAGAVARRVEFSLAARPPQPGETEVVLGPGVGGVLVHELVGHGLEADSAISGTWITESKQKTAAEELSVIDDPRRGRAPWRVDDEGEPARATCLIRGGAVREWLTDLKTARASGRPPTGHGRRSSFRERIRPRMGCTFIGAGRSSPGELIERVREGIYVRRMDAGTVEPRTGRAVFRVTEADTIRNGRTVSPLKPHLLEVDGRKALAEMRWVADDLTFDVCVGSCHRDGQPLAISVGAPTIWLGVATVFV